MFQLDDVYEGLKRNYEAQERLESELWCLETFGMDTIDTRNDLAFYREQLAFQRHQGDLLEQDIINFVAKVCLLVNSYIPSKERNQDYDNRDNDNIYIKGGVGRGGSKGIQIL